MVRQILLKKKVELLQDKGILIYLTSVALIASIVLKMGLEVSENPQRFFTPLGKGARGYDEEQ